MTVNVNTVVPPIDNANTSSTPESGTPVSSGKTSPVAGSVPPLSAPSLPPIDTQKAIEQIADFVNNSARGILFRVDNASGRTVVTVVNPNSGEVIRQMPSEEFLRLADVLRRTGELHLLETQA